MQAKIHTLAEFQQAARDFALGLKPLPNCATVAGLVGDLGAGKTTFVQAAAKTLGVSAPVQSPTFPILKSYQLSAKSYKLLVHMDAYRLKNSTELARLRFSDLLTDLANLIFVEWADRVADILPPDHRKIFFEFACPVRDREGSQRVSVSNGVDDTTRTISFS